MNKSPYEKSHHKLIITTSPMPGIIAQKSQSFSAPSKLITGTKKRHREETETLHVQKFGLQSENIPQSGTDFISFEAGFGTLECHFVNLTTI